MKEETISKSEKKRWTNWKINEFEGKIAIKANTINQPIIKCDDMNNIADAVAWGFMEQNVAMMKELTMSCKG